MSNIVIITIENENNIRKSNNYNNHSNIVRKNVVGIIDKEDV